MKLAICARILFCMAISMFKYCDLLGTFWNPLDLLGQLLRVSEPMNGHIISLKALYCSFLRLLELAVLVGAW